MNFFIHNNCQYESKLLIFIELEKDFQGDSLYSGLKDITYSGENMMKFMISDLIKLIRFDTKNISVYSIETSLGIIILLNFYHDHSIFPIAFFSFQLIFCKIIEYMNAHKLKNHVLPQLNCTKRIEFTVRKSLLFPPIESAEININNYSHYISINHSNCTRANDH